MKELTEIIGCEMAAHGVIPFARFMELALYCPDCGFYDRIGNTIGRTGDFYTSVSVGPLFGELLARQLARWLAPAESPGCRIVEAGSHDGRLAMDILRWLKVHDAPLYGRMEYWILEPSRRRQAEQRRQLAAWLDRVRWFNAWSEFPSPGVRGVILSNELLDAMPVHRLAWNAASRSWDEWGVGREGGRFVWRKLPSPTIPAATLPKVPPGLDEVLCDGFIAEVSPAAEEWWRAAATALKRGRLLTIDYGLTADKIFAPERSHGTLRAYHRHRLHDDLLANAGEQDITAHVDFGALQAIGEAAGLRTESLQTQARFLTRIVEATSRDAAPAEEWSGLQTRQFRTLIHPEHLGERFKVLIQER